MPTYDPADQVIISQGGQGLGGPASGDPSYGGSTVASSSDSGSARDDYFAGVNADDGDDDSPSAPANNPFYWQDAVVDQIYDDIKGIANSLDMNLNYLLGWFDGHQGDMLTYLNNNFVKPVLRSGKYGPHGDDDPGFVQAVINAARGWVGMHVPGYRDALKSLPSGGGGGGGSGRNIRASFDLDEMTRAVNDYARGLILAEMPNARAIAKAYVDAVVANPSQKRDFTTFVRERVLETSRAKAIYENKPDSMSHEQYLQPYVQAFQQIAGPGYGEQQANTAINAARLQASPAAFQARLMRTSQVQSSAPFLSRLSDRMSGFRQVLR